MFGGWNEVPDWLFRGVTIALVGAAVIVLFGALLKWLWGWWHPTRIRVHPRIINEIFAVLHVENDGPETTVLAKMERIGERVSGTVPYQMFWREQDKLGNQIRENEVGVVEVVEVSRNGTRIIYRDQGGFYWDEERGDMRSLELVIVLEATPPLEKPFRRKYVVRFGENGQMEDFSDAGEVRVMR